MYGIYLAISVVMWWTASNSKYTMQYQGKVNCKSENRWREQPTAELVSTSLHPKTNGKLWNDDQDVLKSENVFS